jgi:hypothetical protein
MAPDAASKTPRFTHKPLDESEDCIRVFAISLITLKSLDIKCTVKYVRLSERPKYEALSYMWGDSSKTADILIDGEIFGVTANLRNALWYLSQPLRRCCRTPMWRASRSFQNTTQNGLLFASKRIHSLLTTRTFLFTEPTLINESAEMPSLLPEHPLAGCALTFSSPSGRASRHNVYSIGRHLTVAEL